MDARALGDAFDGQGGVPPVDELGERRGVHRRADLGPPSDVVVARILDEVRDRLAALEEISQKSCAPTSTA